MENLKKKAYLIRLTKSIAYFWGCAESRNKTVPALSMKHSCQQYCLHCLLNVRTCFSILRIFSIAHIYTIKKFGHTGNQFAFKFPLHEDFISLKTVLRRKGRVVRVHLEKAKVIVKY